jgi:hypothetical protein
MIKAVVTVNGKTKGQLERFEVTGHDVLQVIKEQIPQGLNDWFDWSTDDVVQDYHKITIVIERD